MLCVCCVSCHREKHCRGARNTERQNMSIKVFYCNCSNSFMPMNHSRWRKKRLQRIIKTTPACDWRERAGRDCRGLPESSWSIRDTLELPRWKTCTYLTPMQPETTLFFSLSRHLNRWRQKIWSKDTGRHHSTAQIVQGLHSVHVEIIFTDAHARISLPYPYVKTNESQLGLVRL